MKNLFKMASLLLAAAMLFACEENNNTEDNADALLVLTADKYVMQTENDHVLLTVTLDGKVLKEGLTFVDGNEPVELTDFKFSSAQEGEHYLWVNYGTYNSEKIKITVVDFPVPQPPAEDPSKTAFETKVLIAEFTGVQCPNCPFMKKLVHDTVQGDMAKKVIEVSCHTYGNGVDPAQLTTNFDSFSRVPWYPYLFIDMHRGLDDYRIGTAAFTSELNSLYNEKKDTAAGISVNSVNEDGQVVVKAHVKSAMTANYRIGAFLLEDGIEYKQSAQSASDLEDWMHIHDNVIRYIDAYSENTYYGYPLGELKSGEVKNFEFVWDLAKIWKEGAIGNNWEPFVVENMHFVIFVTTMHESGEYYYVSNVVDCPIGEPVPYQYK